MYPVGSDIIKILDKVFNSLRESEKYSSADGDRCYYYFDFTKSFPLFSLIVDEAFQTD